MVGQIRNSSRLVPFISDSASPVALFVKPNYEIHLVSLGCSFFDANHVFGTTAGAILQSRLAVIAGTFGDDPNNFSPTYNIDGYQKLVDFYVNDVGPDYVQFSPDAEDGPVIESGQGATILIANPIVTGQVGTHFLANVFAASTSLGRVTRFNPGARASSGSSAVVSGGGPISHGPGPVNPHGP